MLKPPEPLDTPLEGTCVYFNAYSDCSDLSIPAKVPILLFSGYLTTS